MANIFIDDVKLTPSVVNAGQSFIISVLVKDKIYGILNSDGRYILAANSQVIEKSPRVDS